MGSKAITITCVTPKPNTPYLHSARGCVLWNIKVVFATLQMLMPTDSAQTVKTPGRKTQKLHTFWDGVCFAVGVQSHLNQTQPLANTATIEDTYSGLVDAVPIMHRGITLVRCVWVSFKVNVPFDAVRAESQVHTSNMGHSVCHT